MNDATVTDDAVQVSDAMPAQESKPTSAPNIADLDLVAQAVRHALAKRFALANHSGPDPAAKPPQIGGPDAYAAFVAEHALDFEERVTLALGLAPHLQPGLMDELIGEVLPRGGDFQEIGGVRGKQFRGFLPTAETVLFVLAGNHLEKRLALQHRLFAADHPFAVTQVLRVDAPQSGEPAMSGQLVVDRDFVSLVATGEVPRPSFSMDFPAEPITSQMAWDDLVLPVATMQQIRELQAWICHGGTLLDDWGMHKKLKRGYRVLFHGPPGTGKTLTATLLGKYTERDVYRVDLAMVVSKYIGETEKNLANLFNKAEHKDWILFFDEADALFGKRTTARDAHDRYANQEIAYLLQRVETFDGLVILASNFKNNIDEAFLRRFQASVHFPLPEAAERFELWRLAFPEPVELADDIDLGAVARQHEMTGAHIMNTVQFACLRALDRGDCQILKTDLEIGIRRELSKDGKTV